MHSTTGKQSKIRKPATGKFPPPNSHTQYGVKRESVPYFPMLPKGHFPLPNFAVRSTLFKSTAPNRHKFEKKENGELSWTENRGLDGYQHFYYGELLTVFHARVFGHVLALCWPEMASGGRVYFRLYKLLQMMGSKTGGSNYASLSRALETLASCELSPAGGKDISGPLLNYGYDEAQKKYYIDLPKSIRNHFLVGDYTLLCSKDMKDLRGNTTKLLYAFFSSHDLALENGLTAEFLQKNIVGSSSKKSVFLRLMPYVVKQLTRAGVLVHAEIIDGKLIYSLPKKPKSVKQALRKKFRSFGLSKSNTRSSIRPPP
ncbi:MAG: hypothetical protein EG822_06740 [Deltaproteobacteria bacterium]|nr:hypothetical protein [Deltaproteobacteria bacterium]TLN02429.1 MAG: hypothetical protein FDZ73_12040 [bacterium]